MLNYSGYRVMLFGAGCMGINAVDGILKPEQNGIEYFAIDSDPHTLEESKVPNKLMVRNNKGIDCYRYEASSEACRKSEKLNIDQLRAVMYEPSLVFIITGVVEAGVAQAVAELFKEKINVLTIVIILQHSAIENKVLTLFPKTDINTLSQNIDSILTTSYDKLGILVQCILDLISLSAIINIKLSELRDVLMTQTGIMKIGAAGSGWASGEDRAVNAAHMAVTSLDIDRPFADIMSVLISIKSKEDVSLDEIEVAVNTVRLGLKASDKVLLFNCSDDSKLEEDIEIKVICFYEELSEYTYH